MAEYLTVDGLEIPTVEDIRATMAEEQRAAIDPLLANDSNSILGILNAVVASHDREGWESTLSAAWASDPNAAEGDRLSVLASLTGTIKQGKTASTVTLQVLLQPAVTLLAGVHKARITGVTPDVVWVLTEDVTNPNLIDGVFLVDARCETLGPVAANANTVTTIQTPVTGWLSVSNLSDATIGKDEETDNALRFRRAQEIYRSGSCTLASTKAKLLAHTNTLGETQMLSVLARENVTDDTDPVAGLPAHSANFIVWDGLSSPIPDGEIDTIVEDNRPPGNVSTWARATSRPFEVRITGTRGANYVGDAACKAAIAAAYTSDLEPSELVTPYRGGVAALSSGYDRVTEVALRFQGSPTWLPNASLVVGATEIGTTVVGSVTLL